MLGGWLTKKQAALLALFTASWLILGLGCVVSGILTLLVYLATGGWRFARVFALTIRRDMKALFGMLLPIRIMTMWYTFKRRTVADLFTRIARKYPNKVAFKNDQVELTFSQADEMSNAVANYFQMAGFGKGDVVSLLMLSCPEYPIIWLGLSKLGVITALINFNLRRDSLAHCINVAGSKAVICGADLAQALAEVAANLNGNPGFYSWGTVAPGLGIQPTDLQAGVANANKCPPLVVHQKKFTDKLLYIYTSGTTGLPKAAVISNARYFYMAYSVRMGLNITTEDTLYMALPLYHTAGGIIGVGQVIMGGSSGAVRSKFSASAFWEDCCKYDCTVSQYIGEICRYILAQPPREFDNKHRIRLMTGNGLSPNIWRDFQRRFGVGQIAEFYGATEGNCNIINITNKEGSVGFGTRIAPSLYPIKLIRVDEEGEPVRDSSGVCIEAGIDEPGELVGRITRGDPTRDFEGYVGSKETSKKIARDVFKKGDLAFLTGDVLVMDELGNMYFLDRRGDTFRWKGENVSTAEVEKTISASLSHRCCTVYGVEIPGYEGKCGMAAIVDPERKLDMASVASAVTNALPMYARPLFVRLVDKLEMTGTEKYKKVDLQKEGFDVSVIRDPLFFLDLRAVRYIPLDGQLRQDILVAKVRV